MEYIHIPTGVRVTSDVPLPSVLYKPAGEAAPKRRTPKKTQTKE